MSLLAGGQGYGRVAKQTPHSTRAFMRLLAPAVQGASVREATGQDLTNRMKSCPADEPDISQIRAPSAVRDGMSGQVDALKLGDFLGLGVGDGLGQLLGLSAGASRSCASLIVTAPS